MRLFALVAFALPCVLLSAPADAQDFAGPTHTPTENEIGEARNLYRAGNAAADAGQFADALASFTRAYALSGNPAALYNEAKTLRALGRHVAARDAFDALLSRHTDVSADTRTEALSLRAEEARRIARLSLLDLPDAEPALVLRMDGTVHVDGGARPLELEIDPGQHGLVVSREHFRPFTWDGVLADGEHQAVHVRLDGEPTGQPGVFESPLLWGVTLGIAAVVAGILIGVFLWQGAQLTPNSMHVLTIP